MDPTINCRFTNMTARSLRNMIHESECAAREANEPTCDRERELATQACVSLWLVADHAPGRHLAKLVSCVRRLSTINFQRWANILIALENIFHKTLDCDIVTV